MNMNRLKYMFENNTQLQGHRSRFKLECSSFVSNAVDCNFCELVVSFHAKLAESRIEQKIERSTITRNYENKYEKIGLNYPQSNVDRD